MKNFQIVISIVLLIFGFSSKSAADYYQYLDKDGNIHFTDNLTDVPTEQLNQIKSFESAKPEKAVTKAVNERYKQPSKTPPDLSTWDGQVQSAAQELEREKDELKLIYNKLAQEKAQLQEISTATMNPDEKKAYKQKTDELNTKIGQYHNQCNALKSKIDKFYQEIK